MVNICIVEDEQAEAALLENYIHRYAMENGEQISITRYSDGMDLVDEYQGQFDIVLLDIQMKHLDGMSAAEKIRQVDDQVVIIFITSTVQYAVQGYMVDALGYVLKPVPYPAFEKLLQKSIQRTALRKAHHYISISVNDKILKLDCSTVSYIESQRNNVIVHAAEGDYVTLGPLKRFEEMLASHGFEKCHNAYLVNLSCVKAVSKEEVELTTGEVLAMSRAKKKEFMAALAEGIL